jgi:peptide/nickel transport system permease protein
VAVEQRALGYRTVGQRVAAPLGVMVRGLWRFALRKPLGAFGALVLLMVVAMAIFAPWIARYPYDEAHLSDILKGPSLKYFFGTDQNGRDIFSRIVYGAQVTAVVGLGSVALSAIISGVVGIVSGYLGGRVDTILQRVVDVWMSFPALYLLLTFAAILGTAGGGVLGIGRGPDWGPNIKGMSLIITLGIILAGGSSRVVRSAVLAIKAQPFVEAARVTGAGPLYIMLRHILPNVLPVIIVLATLQLGVAVLAEATVSFLGFGIPPPFPSWGQMLAGRARELGPHYPWIVLAPGAAIFLTVYAFNMLGDALRDLLDPRLRGMR